MTYSHNLNKIVIWKRSDNSYYYRVYKRILNPFEIGYKNSYEHEVVLIIDDLDIPIRKKRHILNQNLKNKIISLINKL